jgi:hypothetical protein
VHILASLVEPDGVQQAGGAALLEPLQLALREAGLARTCLRQATIADVVGLGSSWAKRLGIPERRPAWFLTAGSGDLDGLARSVGG